MRLFWIACALVALVSCAGGEDIRGRHLKPKPTITVPFRPEQVQHVNTAGSAVVTGNASPIDDTGNKLPGALATVQLIPVAEYSEAVMQHMFGDGNFRYKSQPINNLDFRYSSFMRSTRADHLGNFTFSGVPAGEYFVYSSVSDAKRVLYFGARRRLMVLDGQTHTVRFDGL